MGATSQGRCVGWATGSHDDPIMVTWRVTVPRPRRPELRRIKGMKAPGPPSNLQPVPRPRECGGKNFPKTRRYASSGDEGHKRGWEPTAGTHTGTRPGRSSGGGEPTAILPLGAQTDSARPRGRIPAPPGAAARQLSRYREGLWERRGRGGQVKGAGSRDPELGPGWGGERSLRKEGRAKARLTQHASQWRASSGGLLANGLWRLALGAGTEAEGSLSAAAALFSQSENIPEVSPVERWRPRAPSPVLPAPSTPAGRWLAGKAPRRPRLTAPSLRARSPGPGRWRVWTPDVAGTAPPRCSAAPARPLLAALRRRLRRPSSDSGSHAPHFIPVPGEQRWVYVFIWRKRAVAQPLVPVLGKHSIQARSLQPQWRKFFHVRDRELLQSFMSSLLLQTEDTKKLQSKISSSYW